MIRRIAYLLVLIVLSAGCSSLDIPLTESIPTVAPVIATETPAPFIVPLTDTPLVVDPAPPTATDVPVVDTPIVVVTEIPVEASPPPASPQWWQVYFTDPLIFNDPGNYAGSVEDKLIQQINAAQTSIHISAFEFSLTPVAEALIAAHNRGVQVQWLTDDKNGLNYDTQPGRGQFAMLLAAGIEVKDDARSALMHNKFWIFDGHTVWTGSTNATVNGIFKQNNNVLVIHSTEIAYIYEREFQELWSGRFGPRAPSTVNTQWAILDGTPIQVLFSAEDRAVDHLVALVNDAETSIRFLAFSFTDYPLAKAMIDRSAAGVDLKGIYETFGSTGTGSEMKTFLCAGLLVRQDGNGSFLHHKVIIIDEQIVVTGSLNYSSNADESNEENVVILDNPDIANLYLQEFDKLWGQAHDVEPGTVTCP